MIEILVVVAIIALLVAILLPTLARARAQAKIAACNANLHHLGNGCMQYAMSYREYFPLTSSYDDSNWYSLWKARMLPNVNTLICPATRNWIPPQTLRAKILTHNSPEGVLVPYFADASNNAVGVSRHAKNRDEHDDVKGGHSYQYTAVYGGGYGDRFRPLAGRHRQTRFFKAYLSEIALAWDSDSDKNPDPRDNHGELGTNFLFSDGHAKFVKKLSGTLVDMTAGAADTAFKFGQTQSVKTSDNALIDDIHYRSWEPWYYFRQ